MTESGAAPEDLAAALQRNAAARRAWDALPPSHRREYSDWITEARRAETRQRRIARTLERLESQGD